MDNTYTLEILHHIPDNWLLLYEPGMIVWLTKEKRYAVVCSHFQPDPPYPTGLLSIDKPEEPWFVSPNGLGVDGSLIMQPLNYNIFIIKSII